MRAIRLCVCALVLASFAAATIGVGLNTLQDGTVQVQLLVPPRYMWGWGPGLRGYCGEFSFQSFGLLFGNYLSAEAVRNAADGRELLIGVNDDDAAKNLHFDYESWNFNKESTPQSKKFMAWAAEHVDLGHGVVSGFYEEIKGGDEDYDHIMPIMGYLRDETVRKSAGIVGSKDRDDVLGVYYHDLWRDATLYGANGASFIKSRSDCVPPSGTTPKGPYNFCLPKQYNYGIALKGNRDDNGELVRTRLIMPSWTEPDYGKEDQLHESTVEFTVTLVLEGLTAGKQYAVLRFDRLQDVPSSGFLKGAYSHRTDITATGSTMTIDKFDTFRSDGTIFYRTVAL